MGLLTVIVLVGAWAVFLVPSYLRGRSDRRPGSSVTDFRRGLDVLGRAAPSPSGLRPVHARRLPVEPSPGMPVGRDGVRRRRRDVLVGLSGAAVLTLVLGLAFGGTLMLLHLTVDVALVGYVYLLVQMRKAAVERSVKVRYLGAASPGDASLVVLRRSVSG